MAIAFESEHPSRFEKFTDGIYLSDTEGRPTYSVTFKFNARAHVSSPFTERAATQASRRYLLVSGHGELRSVCRLYAQMAENENEPLKAFLFGWSAVEILVSKVFVAFENEFMSPLLDGAQARLRQRFLSRVQEVMKDKYRLVEKFTCVTVALFPHSADTDVDSYLEQFKRLKGLRDKLLHGQDVPEDTLPVHELAGLLRRYVLAFLERTARSSEASD